MAAWTPRQWLCAGLIAAWAAAPAAGQERQAMVPWWYRARQAEVGHYWIKTDLPAGEADALARHLNLMYEQYVGRLASLPARAPTPLNVLLFADRLDYEETLRRRYGLDAEGTGGLFFVKPAGTALALWTGGLPPRRVLHVLQHEGFHQFAYSRFGRDLPRWVNEGLAELFGASVMVDGSLLIGQVSARALDDVRSSIELGTSVPFDTMLVMTPAQWSEALAADGAAGLYAQSWSMVHFLVYGEGGRYQAAFERYLRLINAGYRSREAFVRAFDTEDFGPFERRWQQYVTNASPDSFVTALERLEFLAAGARELARREVFPESLAELRAGLEEIDFTFALHEHAGPIVLRTDSRMFAIPPTGSSREGGYEPVFVVSRPDLRRPAPSVIETRYLKPRELAVRWRGGEDGEVFTHDIVVR
jgi:hypothetical protein